MPILLIIKNPNTLQWKIRQKEERGLKRFSRKNQSSRITAQICFPSKIERLCKLPKRKNYNWLVIKVWTSIERSTRFYKLKRNDYSDWRLNTTTCWSQSTIAIKIVSKNLKKANLLRRLRRLMSLSNLNRKEKRLSKHSEDWNTDLKKDIKMSLQINCFSQSMNS